MLRTGRAIALTLFALLLTCGVRADDATEKDKNKKPDPIEEIKLLRTEVASKISSMDEKLKKLDKLDALDSLQTKLNSIESNLSKRQTDLEKQVDDLKGQLKAQQTQINNFQDSIKLLRDSISSQPRVSRAIDPAPLVPASGQIRMVNQLGVPVTIILENTAYVLQAGQSRLLDNRPTGPLNYQVQAPGYATTTYNTKVDPNERLSILVTP